MIKKFKVALICILGALAAVCICVLAGCKLNQSLDDIINENNLTARVTYFLNEGEFENKASVRHMYYREGLPAFNIGTEDNATSGTSKINALAGYTFDGWYVVQPDADGKVHYTDGSVFDENDTFKPSETGKKIEVTYLDKYDFSKRLAAGDHIYLCGKWEKDISLTVKLVPDGFTTLTVGETEYVKGSELKEYPPVNGEVTFPDAPLKALGYTFVEFYEDETCSTVFNGWPLALNDDTGDLTLYAKYIQGDWKIVKTADDVVSMFGNGIGADNYYIFDNINCTGKTARSFNRFYGKIQGNGKTISNLTLTGGGYLSSAQSVALFGRIDAEAEITDVTFAGLKLTYNVATNSGPDIYFAFTEIRSGATISGVELGGTMEVLLSTDSNEGPMTESNWLFGGYDQEGDAAYTGITITAGTTCTVKDAEGTTTTYTCNGLNQK